MDKINDLINEQREALDKLEAEYFESVPLVDDVIATLGDKILDIRYPNSLDLSLKGNKQDLIDLFKMLRSKGWKTDFRPTTHASSYSGFWTHEKSKVRLWINFSSTVCKLVRTGTKMVEQPVYEVICDDDIIDDSSEASRPATTDLPF